MKQEYHAANKETDVENHHYFKVPDNLGAMIQLMWSIPQDWLWVDGLLVASQEQIDSGGVALTFGYKVSRYGGLILDVKDRDGKQDMSIVRSEMTNFMLSKLMPHSVEFDTVGETKTPSLEDGINIAAGFLENGYRGRLTFYSDSQHNRRFENRARCNIQFIPWCGAPIQVEEAGAQPARLHCYWLSGCGGTEADIQPIILACRTLGLEEYKPRPNLALCA